MAIINNDMALGLAQKAIESINNIKRQLNTTIIKSGELIPNITNTSDIGSDTLRYKNLYLSGNADIIGGLFVDGILQQINLGTTKNEVESIYLHSNGGTSETIKIYSEMGNSDNSVNIESNIGGISLSSGLTSINAIHLNAINGGINIDAGISGIKMDTS